MKKQLPDLVLEQYLLRELPAKRMQAVRSALEQNPGLQARLKELESSTAAILKTYPAPAMAKAIRAKLQAAPARPKRATFRTWLLPAVAAAAAAGIMFSLLPVFPSLFLNLGSETRLKGTSAQLQIFRKTGQQVDRLQNNSRVRAGDLLQLAYFSSQDTYGVIFSMDGRGRLTMHFPGMAQASTHLALNKKTPLPAAYELDNAPAYERFFLVTAANPLDISKILQAAENLAQNPSQARFAPLPLAAHWHQTSVLLRKDDR